MTGNVTTVQDYVEILAGGLGHPEGPDILPDGRIVMVETYTGKLVAWSPDRGLHDFAVCHGGPNACLLGSDGAVYLTQNGGTAGAWRAEILSKPSIQRVRADGGVEFVATEIGGVAFQAPNDLTFGADGALYFTDPADYLPDDRGDGRIWRLDPSGDGELVLEVPDAYPNGITAELDGSVIWVESYERGVHRLSGGQSTQIAQLPEGHIPDGLKIDVLGRMWVTTVGGGTIDVLSPDGELVEVHRTGGAPLNCVFAGTELYVTDLGEVAGVTAEAFMGGRLLRFDAGVGGQPLFRGTIDRTEPDA